MKKLFFSVILVLVLAGIAFGAFRFFEGRAEKRSFESHDEMTVSESPATLVTEEEEMGDIETVEDAASVGSADESEETVVASAEARMI